MQRHRRHKHANLHIRVSQNFRTQPAFKHGGQLVAEVRPQSAQQHRIDIHQIHGGSDGGNQRIGGLIDHFGHIRIPGSPTLEEHIDGLAAGGIPILGNAGSLDQSATARKRLKTPVTPAAAQRPIHRHGQMADLAGESVRAHHHFAVAHHRAADADIGRQVNKGVRAVHHIQEGRTFGGIPRNLSDGGHLRLIAGHHIQPAHHVEPGEVDVFPTQIAGHQQPHVVGDDARQRKPGSHHLAAASFEPAFQRESHRIELGEDLVRVSAGHILTHPLPAESVAVQIECQATVTIGVDLQADAGDGSAANLQRRAGPPICGGNDRLAFLHHAAFNEHRGQQRERGLGQARLLGQIGTTHRFLRTQ